MPRSAEAVRSSTTASLEKTGKRGSSLIDSGISLDNSNRLEVHSGTLTVGGPVTQISGGVLTAGSWSVFGSLERGRQPERSQRELRDHRYGGQRQTQWRE